MYFMNKFEKDCVRTSVIKLASLKATGNPSELASRFGISIRTVKRIVKELRDQGINIYFDHASDSYVLKKDDIYVV